MNAQFDSWLEGQLALLVPATVAPASPRYMRAGRQHPWWRLKVAALPAALSTKFLVVAGTVAIAAAGVGVKTAVTGNPDPLNWSHGAQPIVQGCMASAPASPGAGHCVSAGPPPTAGAGARSATPGTGSPTPQSAPGRSQDHPTPSASPGRSQDHPTPPASPGRSQSHPTPNSGESSGKGGGGS